VGAIQRRKNQAMLVRAFRALPPEWTLVLAGSEGYEAAEALREIANSPCVERIVITGYITDAELAAWYARARIFAFPSLDEGFGMPTLEAMQAGVPVIAGNRSALPEICGGAALLVNPDSEDELAAALTVLAQDQAKRDELVREGLSWSTQFRWERAVEQTATVYREITA
jgi:glycosyltransferase involved in cell wall biosynthesis